MSGGLPRRPNTAHLDAMACPVWAVQRRPSGRGTWETSALYFTYEEARAVAEYEAGKVTCSSKWRAYGLPAHGQLKRLLDEQTDARVDAEADAAETSP